MAPHGRTTSVTIKFANPGTQPPVYVAGSFSQPEWDPQEMPYTTKDDGEYEYTKEVSVEEGKQYQYKFRIGAGDWWVLNEEAPTVTDNVGNKNNLLSVPADYLTASEFEQDKRATDINPQPSKDSPIPSSMDHQESNAIDSKVDGAIADGHENLSQPRGEIKKEMPTIASNNNEADEKERSFMETPQQPTAMKKAIHPIIETIRQEHRNGASTPELADVAAEVADSAAILDRSQPTPPISDEEAGRIGYRRMSSTPIPEVAKTAAEVADVAATLDKDKMHIELPPAPKNFQEDDDIEYATTPEEDRVPLFPHECPGPTDKVAGSFVDHPRNSTPPTPVVPQSEEVIDVNDPTLVPFPTDREGVYAQILTLEKQLLPDDSLPGTPPPASPAIGSSRSAERFDIPPPRELGNQSPSLHAISEDPEVDHVSLIARKHRTSTLRSKSGSQSRRSLGSSDSIEKTNPEVKTETQHKELTQDKDGKLPSNGVSVETQRSSSSTGNDEPQVQPTIEHNTPAVYEQAPDVERKKENSDLDAPAANRQSETETVRKDVTYEQATASADRSSPIPAPTKPLSFLSLSSDGASQDDVAPDDIANASVMPVTGKRTGHSHPIKDSALSHPKIEIDDASSQNNETNSATTGGGGMLTSDAPAVSTPFIADEERQLGHGKERQFSATNEGPQITLQQATPRSSLRTGTDLSEGPAEGESTAVSTNGNSELVSRKKARTISPSPDRPLTPSSIRSSHKDFKSKNFLKAFWRVVFVDWIGGLFMRLFGGGRDSLLVATMLIVVFGSAFYFSSPLLAKNM